MSGLDTGSNTELPSNSVSVDFSSNEVATPPAPLQHQVEQASEPSNISHNPVAEQGIIVTLDDSHHNEQQAQPTQETVTIDKADNQAHIVLRIFCCGYFAFLQPTQGAKLRLNILLLLLASMIYKFSYESLSNAVALFALTRYAYTGNAATILIALNISNQVTQSLVTSFISIILLRIRASIVIAMALTLFSLLISTLIILEATTGGTLVAEGNWNPWILFPIFVGIGACVGIFEVVRKIIPPLLFTSSTIDSLTRVNSAVHICYELSGTVGALLSSVFISNLGYVYALCHMPVAFMISAVLFLFIRHRSPDAAVLEELGVEQEDPLPDTKDKKTDPCCVKCGHLFINAYKSVASSVHGYFIGLFYGAKIVLFDFKYSFLIAAFVIPQVLHRLIENAIIPVFAKEILKQGSYSGIMVGGSNFGELTGAASVFLTVNCITNFFHWVRFDAVAINLMWVFAFIPTSASTVSLPVSIALGVMMISVSASWAAADISLLAYIQETIPAHSKDGTYSPLSCVMSFLYSCYILSVAGIGIGVGQALDAFKRAGQIQYGFFIIFSVFSLISIFIFVSSFISQCVCKISRHKPKEAKEVEQKVEVPKNEEPATQQSVTAAPVQA